jgi:nucleoside phosphorylase
MKDFFISYDKADRAWAEWIAWQLEEANDTVIIQTWDFRLGKNFVFEMDRAIRESTRTIAVLSPDYLSAFYTHSEWAAAFSKDPMGLQGTLLPIRVRKCKPTGLLALVVYTDLVDCDEGTAIERLLAVASNARGKPKLMPSFPKKEHILSKPRAFLISHQSQHFKPSEKQQESKTMISSKDQVLSSEQEPLIDFAIITAIEVERLAICKAFGLTDKHRAPKEARQYWRGRLPLDNGEFYEIVVAQLPDMANVDAALSANDMIHHWKPGALLMVGIAAAATKEQMLGDAIIGSDVYYYERGKVTPEGVKPEFKVYKADATLWSRAITLPKWTARIPVPRPDGKKTRPNIHYGVIASGEKVIADQDRRDSIASQHRKIVAIEMEGYGVSAAAWQSFNHVRHLVIRAICDLADSTKNNIWHPYAAAVAAGLVKHLLRDRPLEPRNVGPQTKNPETQIVKTVVSRSASSDRVDTVPVSGAVHRVNVPGRRRQLGVPGALLNSLRSALLACDELSSDAQLVAVFSSAELKPWRAGLPSAPHTAARADLVVGYLVNKFRTDGENALILLLKELSYRYDPNDERHGRLLGLVGELEQTFL